MKRFLRRLKHRISDIFYDTLGIINADRIYLSLVRRRQSSRDAVERHLVAIQRLESKGEKGSDAWHVERAMCEVHDNDLFNMTQAVAQMRRHLDAEKSITLKVVRWLRDWVC